MHDRKTVPTFLIYGGGWVFLAAIAWAWVVQPFSNFVSRHLGFSTPTEVAAIGSCLATLSVQCLLITLWQHWTAPKAPASGDAPRLLPDKRERIQTGQMA